MSTDKAKLKQIDNLYKKYIDWGYNSIDSAERSVEESFKGEQDKGYICRNGDGEPSYVFFKDSVYFFGGSIYSK